MLQRWRPSKARRSWNGACELLRRGISTPTPVAFFEKRHARRSPTSYYIYERFEDTGSVRKAFTAFAEGRAECDGCPADTFYDRLSDFLVDMHTRGVFFRDLSAGNILYRLDREGRVDFCLIDTARARFFPHNLSLARRLADLRRITHPLDWAGRRRFIGGYLEKTGRRFTWWVMIPFMTYDLKHWLKARLRRPRAKG